MLGLRSHKQGLIKLEPGTDLCNTPHPSVKSHSDSDFGNTGPLGPEGLGSMSEIMVHGPWHEPSMHRPWAAEPQG